MTSASLGGFLGPSAEQEFASELFTWEVAVFAVLADLLNPLSGS